ncbi:MAG: GNAT family N-acetyltransferase [Proteobacteria bacterium]|nr:GNAT family N-acetyltransferase [Pseudomonadota bacterium]
MTRLIRVYLPQVDPERRYEWLYRGCPHGSALTWLASDDDSGKVIGMTSFFLRRLWVDGTERLGALGGDGFVLPEARGHGIGTSMHRSSRAMLADQGVDVMFGTPSDLNRGPLDRSGASDVTAVGRYSRPLKLAVGPLAGIPGIHRLSWVLQPRSYRDELQPMLRNDRRVDEVWQGFISAHHGRGIATVRSAEFYTWRFLDSPSRQQLPYVITSRDGTPIGACALQRLGRRLIIVDLISSPASIGRCLTAIGANSRGSNVVDLRLALGHWTTKRLWRHGYFLRDKPRMLNVMTPAGSELEQIFRDGQRWYFTWLESDMDSLD